MVGRAATIVALSSWALSHAAGPAAKPSPKPRPSVVLITLDTTRADRLGCYGKKDAGTPNLDKLASAGVRFAEAWSPAPITLPAHLSMLTGCTPVTHGVRDNGETRYDDRIPTLANRFAAAGYRTAAVVSASVLDAIWGANAGFGVYDDRFEGRPERSGAAATTRALEILGASTDPIFLWVHYYDPHWKYEPPAPFADRFKGDPYQGEIASVDFEVGRLLAGLEKAGVKPIVVVAADHGEGLGEHGEKTHGIFTYRSTLRVPLLFAGPGILAGRVVAEPVSLVDIAPTIAALAGLPPAAIEDGISLAGVVARGDAAPAKRALYYESMLPFNSFGWVPPRGDADARYAYIDLPKKEVYDLRSDPGQLRNLYANADPLSASLARRFDELAAGLAERAGIGSPVQMSEEQRAKLASLGYLPGISSKSGTPTLDPKDVVELAEQVDRAKELHESGRYEETIAAADAILRRNPENVPALTVRAQALLSQKRYREAALAFGNVVARNPAIAGVRFDLGSSLAGAGDTAKAEAEWQKAIELEPHFAEPRVSLIAAALARGETDKALAASKAAIDSGSESPELSFEIGMSYASAGDIPSAEKWFLSAVRLRPAYAEALANLGRIAYESGRIEDALVRYGEANRAAPTDSTYLKTMAAILLQDKHDPKGALVAFRAALAIERDAGERERLEAVIAELSKTTKR